MMKWTFLGGDVHHHFGWCLYAKKVVPTRQPNPLSQPWSMPSRKINPLVL